MIFLTDGSPHYEGIGNEVRLKEDLKDSRYRLVVLGKDIKDFTITHIGGTRSTTDVRLSGEGQEFTISAKSKKGLRNGSFDWLNTSSIISDLPNIKYLRKELGSIRNFFYGKIEKKDQCREEIKVLLSSYLNEVGEQAAEIALNNVAELNKEKIICVYDTTTKIETIFNFRDTNLYNTLLNSKHIIPAPEKTLSRKISHIAEDKIYTHNLRIRLALNNGVGPFIGENDNKKGKNKSSTLCFKIQQDSVDKLLDNNITICRQIQRAK